MEQANMLLSGASDANDAIRDANNKTTQTWQNTTKKGDEREKEGESWYHGIMDTVGAGSATSSVYGEYKRMGKLGTSSYGELVSNDLGKVGETLSSLGQSTGKAIDSVGSAIKTAGVKVGAISGGTNLADLSSESMGLSKFTNLPVSAETPTPTPTTPAPTEPDPLTTEDGRTIQTSANIKPAESIGQTTSTTEPKPAPEGEGGGGITGKIVNKLTGGAIEEDSVAAEGLGKVAGNIGGAVDIYKDFENIGKKGGFLGGTGTSGGDELGNALTLGGTALDVASMALPF